MNPSCEAKRCRRQSAWIISEIHLCHLHTKRAGARGIQLKDGRTLHPAWEQSRESGVPFMATLKPIECREGWICEAHPKQGWPHDDCAGPGMPCPVDGMGKEAGGQE